MARVVIAIALAVGGVALWIALRGGDTPPPPPPPPNETRAMDSGAQLPPPIAEDAAPFVHHDPAPAAPVLPTLVDAGPPPPQKSIEQEFAAEVREGGWAQATEAELHKRVDALHDIHVEATDCHTSTCKLVIAGSQGAIATAIDVLQTDKHGLRGWAEKWILTAPEVRGDQMALVAYIHFDRVPHVQGPDDD